MLGSAYLGNSLRSVGGREIVRRGSPLSKYAGGRNVKLCLSLEPAMSGSGMPGAAFSGRGGGSSS